MPSSYTTATQEAMPGPSWLRRSRREALSRFLESTPPSEAEESWRYSGIDELDMEDYPPVGRGGASVPTQAWEDLAQAGTWAGSIITSNGEVVDIEGAAAAGQGVSLSGLAQADLGSAEVARAGSAEDRFILAADAFLLDAVVIRIPAGLVLADPLLVVHHVSIEGGAAFPRTLVELGEGGRAAVVELFVSSESDCLTVPVTRLSVAAGAELAHVSLQRLGARTRQVGYLHQEVGEQARLASFAVCLGAERSRLQTESVLSGAGAMSQISAAYFGSGDQLLDFRTTQVHLAPRTKSDLLYKGAVADSSRSVYTGLIAVHKGAVGTDAMQTNRNVVLSEGAQAFSVPNLDIAENDVRCSHASAVGPVDAEQRYYLESRGIPTRAAERLIVGGFFEDAMTRVPVPAVVPIVRSGIEAKLARALAE